MFLARPFFGTEQAPLAAPGRVKLREGRLCNRRLNEIGSKMLEPLVAATFAEIQRRHA